MRNVRFRMTPLTVEPHKPGWRRALWLGAAMVAIVAAYFAGEWRGGYERLAARAQRAALTQARDGLERDNRSLRQQLVFLKRSRDVDQAAQAHLKQTNSDLQGQLVTLKKQLSFYHDIVAPGDTEPGVRVQAFKLTSGAAADRYHYSLMLMQGPHHAREVAGTVNMAVVGERGKKQVTLKLATVEAGHSDTRRFKFRYFENLEGNVKLPAGFSPERVEVTVTPSGRHADDPFKRSFEWRVTS